MAAAAIEIGDNTADVWIERAQRRRIVAAGSVLEQAALGRLPIEARLRLWSWRSGPSWIADEPHWRRSMRLGAPLLARLQRERLTSVVGQRRNAVRSRAHGDVHRHRRFDALDVERRQRRMGVILGEHHRLVRAVVGRYRGSIMTSTGDGFSAWFEQPSDAADAARALHQAIEHAALVVPGGLGTRCGSGWPAARCSISAPTPRAWQSPRLRESCRRPGRARPTSRNR